MRRQRLGREQRAVLDQRARQRQRQIIRMKRDAPSRRARRQPRSRRIPQPAARRPASCGHWRAGPAAMPSARSADIPARDRERQRAAGQHEPGVDLDGSWRRRRARSPARDVVGSGLLCWSSWSPFSAMAHRATKGRGSSESSFRKAVIIMPMTAARKRKPSMIVAGIAEEEHLQGRHEPRQHAKAQD